ncbi:Lrp/AsnC family transcriptional regulator [Phocea massiliensis]|uniref:Lrp/AsnC family transcriptional regulator n=1 Tax=Merdimmobilis hominis TaxID=2897707 RepID=A0A938X924_9FIRM|nr:Lrp/AsnC family transcriptional regulator [Merdimmobilis hominis]MBM6920899.1 Lrp/AsnC family transcriptional regulator [Merdimmobilis hominis]
MNKVLRILEENARYTNEEIAMMTGKTAVEVAEEIDRLEKDGVIRGYKAIVDRDRLSDEMPNMVSAIIELRVTPKRDAGFDEIAEKIAQYSEVEDVYLMSGGYDLALTITAKSFKDIALFVSQRLATLDSVLSTATHFILSRYKEKGVVLHTGQTDEREGNWF